MISMLHFETQEGLDVFSVGEGSNPVDGVLWSGSGSTRVRVVFSSSSDMWVKLVTDFEIGASGFVVEVQPLDNDGKYVFLIHMIIECTCI